RALWKGWTRSGGLGPLQALEKSLDELCSHYHLLDPRARGYALVALNAIREERSDLNTREKIARESVELMTRVGSEIGLIDAHLLLGQVLHARGQLGDALSAYEDARTILELQAKARPNDVDLAWAQTDLHTGVGRTLQNRGQLREALVEAEASLDISK